MFDPESYPVLYRPFAFFYRLGVAFDVLFAKRDVNAYKVHSTLSLFVNLLGKVL